MAKVCQWFIVGKDQNSLSFCVNTLHRWTNALARLIDTAVKGKVGFGLFPLRDVTEGVSANFVEYLLWQVG
jgi:hypothetical protein